jgi:hypothetical protein
MKIIMYSEYIKKLKMSYERVGVGTCILVETKTETNYKTHLIFAKVLVNKNETQWKFFEHKVDLKDQNAYWHMRALF